MLATGLQTLTGHSGFSKDLPILAAAGLQRWEVFFVELPIHTGVQEQ